MLKQLAHALARRFGRGASAAAQTPGPAARDRLDACIALAAQRAAAGEHAAAAELYRESLQLQPLDSRIWCNFGAELNATGRAAEAERAYRRALDLDPAMAHAWYNLGTLLHNGNSLEEAERCYREAIALVDADGERWLWAMLRNNLGLLLQNQGRQQDAVQMYRQALAEQPQQAGLHSNLLFVLIGLPGADPQQVLAEHRAWGERFADPLTMAAAAHDNVPDPERVVRIGYVSADFRRHAVARYMEPVLRHHRSGRFEVYCYSNCARPDAVTRQLQELSGHWRDIAAWDDLQAAQQVRDDRIDILVDLSGHTEGNRLLLFARRPAPLQMTWLGYLGTTGMAAFDYRITDPHVDPEGMADACYRERLLRLPQAIVCYQPPAEAPAVGALPALQNGHVTFGSFNSYAKINAETMRAWAKLLARLPQSRLRVVGVPAGAALERLLEACEREGVYADRIDAIGRLPYPEYWAQYLQVDLALDPYPYNGGTTTLDSLWMGVPVISLAGAAGVSRCAASHLGNVGLTELIAHSWDDYVRIGVELAADLPRLAQLRAGLRARMRASPILDAPRFTAALEALYREAWRAWCARPATPGQAG
jgi:predicted O-linked N-acetylglucosamine transferase (SPINDLY family)